MATKKVVKKVAMKITKAATPAEKPEEKKVVAKKAPATPATAKPKKEPKGAASGMTPSAVGTSDKLPGGVVYRSYSGMICELLMEQKHTDEEIYALVEAQFGAINHNRVGATRQSLNSGKVCVKKMADRGITRIERIWTTNA